MGDLYEQRKSRLKKYPTSTGKKSRKKTKITIDAVYWPIKDSEKFQGLPK